MRQLIISDLHLDPNEPERYRTAILSIGNCECDRLILAGDIFEAWVGDDGADLLDKEFLDFSGTHSSDTVFLHGNRDFLITGEFLSEHKIKLVNSPLQQLSTTIIHGDELCTDDVRYQEYRKEVRSSSWCQTFLNKELEERRAIAEGLRKTSREAQANRPEAIGDVAQATVDLWMSADHSDLLIHGHTHRPSIHVEQYGLRAVTSDWQKSGVGVILDSSNYGRKLQLCLLRPEGIELLEEWQHYDGTPEWKRNS